MATTDTPHRPVAPSAAGTDAHEDRAWTEIASPIGALTITRAGNALTGLYMQGHRPAPDRETFGYSTTDGFATIIEQLHEYFAGTRTLFDLPVAATGTPFQQRVWTALTEIPYGETRSYAWLAERIGQPTAFRAVGLANGRNPVSIIVPCHRVVGANGALTGYGGGVERKAALLAHEQGLGLGAL